MSDQERYDLETANLVANTTLFDAAEYEMDEEDQAELIGEALALGDAAYIAHVLTIVMRSRNITDLARRSGVSRETIYEAFKQDGSPRLETLVALIKALGFTFNVRPVQKAVGD